MVSICIKERFKINRVEDVKEEPPQSLSLPNKIKQTIIFVTRDTLSKLSNKQYLLINLLEAPLLAFILAIIIKYKSAPGGTEYMFRFNENFPGVFADEHYRCLVHGAYSQC